MAEKIKKLEQEFNAASIEARNTFDKLKKWDTLPADYISKNKEKYAQIQEAYKVAQEKKNNARKELDAAKLEQTKAKEAKTAETVYNKTLSALSKAEAGLGGYKGEEKYVAAYQAAQEAFNSIAGMGATPKKALPEPRVEVPVIQQQGTQGTEENQIQGPQSYSDALEFLTDPKNKESLIRAQQGLTNFGYKGNTKGEPDATFTAALNKAATGYANLPAAWRTGSLLDYIVDPTAGATGAGGSGKSDTWGTVSNPTQAKAVINNVVTSLLGREATAKEIKSITKQLVDAQRANPYKKDASGMTVGGVDAQQFITDIITAGDEFATKKQAKQDLTEQSIQSVLNSNGISYKPGQLKAYSDRVKNGEDIKAIESEIRNVASLGQPDAIKKLMAAGTDLETIYAPYKRTMAASLGINPETITLDDPTLRMAIGPDKEMSLYDYKKAIRQDNRWKFSQEANDEVTSMINQVKRDFGFMG